MDAVDQIARDNAMRALAQIDAHEKVCAERAKEAHTWRESTTEKLDSMFASLASGHAAISKSVDGINSQIRAGGIAIIVFLVGVIGYLIKNHGL